MNSQRLAVLHVRSSGGLYGAERAILGLVAHQPAWGVEPIVAAFHPGDADEGAFLRAARTRRCRVLPVPCRGRLDYRTAAALRQFVQEHGVAVVHAHDYKAALYSYFAVRGLRAALVATQHGWDRSGLRADLYSRLETWVLRRSDRVIAVAGPVAAELTRRGVPAPRVATIRNGIDLSDPDYRSVGPAAAEQVRRQLHIPDDQTVIGAVGRLEPVKGHDILLQAFSQLGPRQSRVHLVIAGDGSLRDELPRRAEQLGVRDHVTFAGYWQDIPSLLGMLQLFVLPSESEGLPIAVLEAATAGVPIVATAVGDVPLVVRDRVTGLLVPPGQPEAFARAIHEALHQPALRASLAAAGAAWVRAEFTSARAAQRTCELYREALLESTGERALRH